MPFKKYLFFFIFVNLFCFNAYSQNFLEKVIQERVNQVQQQNQINAEKTGDFSKASPANSKNSLVNSQSDSGIPNTSDGKTNIDVDVKGIKIGMNFEDAMKALSANVKNLNDISHGAIQYDTDAILYGDYMVRCVKTFTYYGTLMNDVVLIFLNDKLKMANFEYIPHFESNNPMPVFASDLIESKFKVYPLVEESPTQSRGRGEVALSWIDLKGDRLIYVLNYEKHLSGYTHKPGKVLLRSSDFLTYTDERRADLENKAKQEQQAIQQKQKSDL